jgi:hypothetical protein
MTTALIRRSAQATSWCIREVVADRVDVRLKEFEMVTASKYMLAVTYCVNTKCH